MKELSIEEKAKAYDEAIERAKKVLLDCTSEKQKVVEYIIPELKESEDERIRKALINGFNKLDKSAVWYNGITNGQILDWLEKQGEHANFRNKIQIGDKVTRNKDGVLVNLSQLDRVAKKDEKQGEQKPFDKVEPKFKVGDLVVYDHRPYQIVELPKEGYINLGLRGNGKIEFAPSTYCRHWTIKDAKDGDILATKAGGIFIYKELLYDKPFAYCGVDKFGVFKDCNCGDGLDWTPYLNDVTPATKEQCDTLEKAMADAGYTFDFEKKELKKIENEIEISFGAKDSKLQEATYYIPKGFYAEIDDDKVVIKKGEKSTAWSEKDKTALGDALWCCEQAASIAKDENDMGNIWYAKNWLKSLKYRVQPKQEWKQENIDDLTDFEIVMMHIGASFFGENAGLDPNDTTAIKEQANILSELVPSKEWSEEDEDLINFVCSVLTDNFNENDTFDDEHPCIGAIVDRLKSLRPQNRWKPSEEQMKVLKEVVDEHFDIDGGALWHLYEDLKKLTEE